MKSNVSIIAVVDVIGALSDSTLGNGNLCLADDGSFDSTGQGTTDLCTVVAPGQTVQWTALAVDVQTPIEIQSITFIGGGASACAPADRPEGSANPDVNVWAGVVPAGLTPGVPYKYRLALKMHEGPHSVLSIDSPALMTV
jgi:hypothetical protein